MTETPPHPNSHLRGLLARPPAAEAAAHRPVPRIPCSRPRPHPLPSGAPKAGAGRRYSPGAGHCGTCAAQAVVRAARPARSGGIEAREPHSTPQPAGWSPRRPRRPAAAPLPGRAAAGPGWAELGGAGRGARALLTAQRPSQPPHLGHSDWSNWPSISGDGGAIGERRRGGRGVPARAGGSAEPVSKRRSWCRGRSRTRRTPHSCREENSRRRGVSFPPS